MQIALGQSVYSSDGQKIGTVDSVLVNPKGSHVAHIVVHRGIFLDDDKVVARDAIERVDAAGVHLSLSSDSVKSLPGFDYGYASGEMKAGYPEVIPGPFQSMILFSTPPPGQTYLEHGHLFQLEPLEGMDERPDHEAASDVVIGKGADVLGSDGQRIGYVHEVAYGAEGTLETVVVQAGGLVRHHRVTIRAGQIAEIGDEVIVLNVPADNLGAPE